MSFCNLNPIKRTRVHLGNDVNFNDSLTNIHDAAVTSASDANMPSTTEHETSAEEPGLCSVLKIVMIHNLHIYLINQGCRSLVHSRLAYSNC